MEAKFLRIFSYKYFGKIPAISGKYWENSIFQKKSRDKAP